MGIDRLIVPVLLFILAITALVKLVFFR